MNPAQQYNFDRLLTSSLYHEFKYKLNINAVSTQVHLVALEAPAREEHQDLKVPKVHKEDLDQ